MPIGVAAHEVIAIDSAMPLIFCYIVGTSMAAARLRAAAWQFILTHDKERYCDLQPVGRHYDIRELEQCVRSVLIREQYHPPRARAPSALEEIIGAVNDGALTAEELVCRYCTWVYSQTSSYEETARRLQLDRRTVRRKIDPTLLSRLRPAR